MKVTILHALVVLATLATSTHSSVVRYSAKSNEDIPKDKPTVVTLDSAPKSENSTRPRGVFLFDNNCLWFLHGKGKLIAKINCVTPKKEAPLIVATRKNGRLHYKLHKGPMRPGRLSGRRRVSKVGQIPLKCFYRYDDKGVFYLTRCYTRTPGYAPVEMNFHGHLPKDGKKFSKNAGCRNPRCLKKRMKKQMRKLRRQRRRLIARRALKGVGFRKKHLKKHNRKHHKKHHKKHGRKHHKKHHHKKGKKHHRKGKKFHKPEWKETKE